MSAPPSFLTRFRSETSYLQKALLTLLLGLSLFSIARLVFLWSNFPIFEAATSSDLATVFFNGIRFDLSALIYINALVLLSFILPLPFRHRVWYQRLQIFLFVLCNGVAFLFEYIDIGFYKYAFRRSILSDLQMMGNNQGNFGQYVLEYWKLLICLLATWLALWYFFKKIIGYKGSKNTVHQGFAMQSLLGILALVLFGIAARGGLQKRPLSPSSAAKYVQNNAQMHLMSNTSLSFIFSSQQRSLKAKTYFSDKECHALFNPQKTPDTNAVFQKKNVVILVLESFGKEVISSFNGYEGHTPFVDSLLNESYYLYNSFANGLRSTQGISAVSASIPSLMSDAFVFSAYQSNKIQGLATMLRAEGYQTAFFHGSNEGSMEFEKFSNQAGFEHFRDRRHYNNDADYDGSWGIWDYPYMEYLAAEIGKMPEPFLTQFFSLTSHHPYAVEDWFAQKYPDMNPVHRAILYTDTALRNFFETIKNESWYENTLFVVVADHVGASEHPEYATRVGRYKIPLFLFTPDGSLKGNKWGVSQQIDILPTVLDYLDYPKTYNCFGESLLNPNKKQIAYQYSGGRFQLATNDRFLLFDGNKTTGLFAYHKDVLLKKNLLKEEKTKADSLTNQLKAIIQTHHKAMINNGLVELKTGE